MCGWIGRISLSKGGLEDGKMGGGGWWRECVYAGWGFFDKAFVVHGVKSSA